MSNTSLQLTSSHWPSTTTQDVVPPQGRKYPTPYSTSNWAYQSSYNSLKQVECLQLPADIFPLTVHHHTLCGATAGHGANTGQEIPHPLLNLTELTRAAIIPSDKLSVFSWYLPTDCQPLHGAWCHCTQEIPHPSSTSLSYHSSYNSLKKVECLQPPAHIFPLTVHHYKGLGATPGQEIPHPLLNLSELTRSATIPSNKLSVSSLQLISSHWLSTTTQGLVSVLGRKYPIPSSTSLSLPEQL